MRIRKLIAQRKVCPTLPSSTPTTIAVIPATSTVQSVPTICEEKEERVNNLQTKKEEVVGVCELNMSVWDVIPAKDLLYYFSDEDFKDLKHEEEDYDDDDKIIDESVNAGEDQISILRDDIESKEDDDEKTEEEEESVEKQYATAYKRKLWLKSLTKKNNEKRKRDCGDDIDSNVKEKKKKENGVVYCCKTDGQGWHCRSKAQKGKPLCKHHLIQVQRNVDDQRDNNQKKIQKLEKKTERRGRPPKESSTKTTSTTIRGRKNKGKLSGGKSSEFFYYSGFGPLWGKNKRGRPPNEVKKQQQDSEKEESNEEECEKLLEEKQEVIDDPPTPKMNIVKEDNNNGCTFVDDEFESDNDDSDEDCNGVNVRKRYRKPIKARSLASLF
ncbi:hypothetical protein C5167_048163 [Papaver somniferum]|uniref:WRC domain-containing protein n=1 Tax=Papaver somniferum TaxID=3469 RepID=A0A4Y7KK20_PAPSO|nr:probable serine/threonine-protein kinase irlF [Papaver somniferum]RZC72680.1 hypothetical protein C5167_048163 [Papaver somniferum]